MLDVKSWLEQSGIPAADTAFTDEQELPFLVFTDHTEYGGADNKNCIVRHSITVEFYSGTIDAEQENAIELLFNTATVAFEKDRIWINGSNMYMTVYDLDDILSKLGG